MSSRLAGGGRGRGERKLFLSSHRCPEVDVLPHQNSETQIPPTRPQLQSEANYLDVSCRSEEEDEEEEDEEGGSISDWSEEDLSLHFSPSVILPSDDEDTDPENSFECVDITVDSQVNSQEGEGPKMVPKRQIQLKKKDAENLTSNEKTEKSQVIPKDGPAKGTTANSDASTNEQLCPTVRHRPDLLLRQHSMPISLHTHSTTNNDVDRGYRGLVAGANQDGHIEANSRQRLQKSVSLDETKTKMASCILKSVLSKKMQAEQNNPKIRKSQQKKPATLPGLPQPADQKRVRDGEGGKTGGSVFKAPAHVVRDMRSVIKNTYSLSFTTATRTAPEKPKSFKVIGQEESPPPTYQQAVGVKGHDARKRTQGTVHSRVTTSLNLSEDRKQSSITEQRRSQADDLILPDSGPVSSRRLSQSERGVDVIREEVNSLTESKHPEGTQAPLPAQEQRSILGLSSQPASSSSQQILHPCFYTPAAFPAFSSTLHPQLGKVSYIHNPLSYIQTQLQPPPAAASLLLRRSEENQSSLTGNTFDQQDHFIRPCSPHRTRPRGDAESTGNAATPMTQEHQQQFVCSVQSLLPTQVGSDLLVDITGSTAAPRAILSGPAPCHIMLDPKSGQYFYVDTPPQPQRKMLLDPETGQYVQVFLPASSSTPNSAAFPVHFANSSPFASTVINPAPTVLSVMQLQPTVAVRSLYAHQCLPFTLHAPSINFTRTTP